MHIFAAEWCTKHNYQVVTATRKFDWQNIRHKEFLVTKHRIFVADIRIFERQNINYWLPTQRFVSDKTQSTGCRHKDLWVAKHNVLVADTRICEWQNTIYWLPTQGFINYKASSTGCRHKGFIYYKTSSTDRRHSDYSVTQHHLLIQCHVHFFLLMISLSYSPSHGIKYI